MENYKPSFEEIIFFLAALALTLSITVAYPVPIGQDIHFHMKIAEIYSRGEDGFYSPYVLLINGMPYPPLLHFMLVPSFWIGPKWLIAKIIQVIAFPLSLLMLVKISPQPYATGLLCLGSWSYIDRLIQAQPQAIDMILFPALMFSYLKGKRWFTTIFVALAIYNHFPVTLLLIAPFFLHFALKGTGFFDRISCFLLLGVIIGAPLLWVISPYVVGGAGIMGSAIQNAQEQAFWESPFMFTLFYLGPANIGWYYAIRKLLKIKETTELEKISLMTIGCLFCFVPFWPDRFLQFVAMPLALLSSELSKSWYRSIVYGFCVVGALLPWLTLFIGGYHVVT